MECTFDWDNEKETSNRCKHGFDFTGASDVLYDPPKMMLPDLEHSDYEERFVTIGYSKKSRLLLVVHTEQEITLDKASVRIISCRQATRQERENYEG